MNKLILGVSALVAVTTTSVPSYGQSMVARWNNTAAGNTSNRGLAYNVTTDHLLSVVAGTTGGSIKIYKASDGTAASPSTLAWPTAAMGLGTGIPSGTSFYVAGICAANDGTIYDCNYTSSGTQYILKWTSESANPTVVWSGTYGGGENGSVGADLAVYGTGNNAIFVLSSSTSSGTTEGLCVYNNGTSWVSKVISSANTSSLVSGLTFIDFGVSGVGQLRFISKTGATGGYLNVFDPTATSPIALTQTAMTASLWQFHANGIHDAAYDPVTGLIGAATRVSSTAPDPFTNYLFTTTGTGTLLAPVLLGSDAHNAGGSDSGNVGCVAWGKGAFFTSLSATTGGIWAYDVTAFKVSDPTNATVTAIQNTNFSVVSGGSSLTYQWKVDKGAGAANVSGAEYSGANTATLTITGASTNDVGTYSCVVNGVSSSTWMSAGATLTVNRLNQTISSFGTIPDKLATDPPFNLSATASSGLPVVYSIVSGPAAVSGNTITLTGLPGTVVVSASQPGNSNYNAAASVPNQSFNVASANHSPVAGADAITRPDQQGTKVSVATLLSNDTDADNDTLSIAAVSAASTQGGTVTLNSGYVFYTPPVSNPASDTFTYTVSDGNGGTDTGTVTVTIATADNSQPHNFQINTLPDGTVKLDCAGIPNITYLIQATLNLSMPSWDTIATNTAGTNGLFEYVDVDATNHPTRYYRTATP